MSIDDAQIGALAYDSEARAKWVHDLRNAVNVAGIGTRLAQRMLEQGQSDDAAVVLTDSLRAWAQCNALLDHATEATAVVAAPHDARASAADRPRALD